MKKNLDHEVGKRLFIELGTSMQLEVKGDTLTFKTELIGMEVNNFLIIRVYLIDEIMRKTLDNSKIVVKYLHKDAIWGFHSSVISIISHPTDLIFITYPEVIEDFDVRVHHRVNCFLSAILSIGDSEIEGTIVDISTEGCRFQAKEFKILDQNSFSKITLSLQTKHSKKGLYLLGEVKNIKKYKDDIIFGVMFSDIDSGTQKILQEIVPGLEMAAKIPVYEKQILRA